MSKDTEREKSDNRDAAGSWGSPQQRSPEGQGQDAPLAKDLGHPEHSIFDGAGNEMVVVTTTDDQGRIRQGTGATREEALENAQKLDQQLGEGFGPGH